VSIEPADVGAEQTREAGHDWMAKREVKVVSSFPPHSIASLTLLISILYEKAQERTNKPRGSLMMKVLDKYTYK
jgi:hypothetical protein